MDDYPLKVIVCGVEHSGTTVFSDVIKRHPNLCGGFECGLLVADNPADFVNRPPWYEWLGRPTEDNHWGMPQEGIDAVTQAPDFGAAYRAIIDHSPLFADKARDRVVDKTPFYVYYLLEMLPKVPSFVPCLVIEKSIENFWRSYKKRGKPVEAFCRGYLHYRNMLMHALHAYSDRMYVVRYERYCREPVAVSRELFDYIGEDYRDFVGPDEERYVREGFKKSVSQVDITPDELRAITVVKERVAPVDWDED